METTTENDSTKPLGKVIRIDESEIQRDDGKNQALPTIGRYRGL
jgi:hypothetical protein